MDCLLACFLGKKGEDSKKENKNLHQFVFADFSSKKVTEFGFGLEIHFYFKVLVENVTTEQGTKSQPQDPCLSQDSNKT